MTISAFSLRVSLNQLSVLLDFTVLLMVKRRSNAPVASIAHWDPYTQGAAGLYQFATKGACERYD